MLKTQYPEVTLSITLYSSKDHQRISDECIPINQRKTIDNYTIFKNPSLNPCINKEFTPDAYRFLTFETFSCLKPSESTSSEFEDRIRSKPKTVHITPGLYKEDRESAVNIQNLTEKQNDTVSQKVKVSREDSSSFFATVRRKKTASVNNSQILEVEGKDPIVVKTERISSTVGRQKFATYGFETIKPRQATLTVTEETEFNEYVNEKIASKILPPRRLEEAQVIFSSNEECDPEY